MLPLHAKEIVGNWATLLLPINEDDTIDYFLLEEEIDRMIAFGVNGIYSNGTAGEFYSQTEDEFDRVSELLAAKCNAVNMPFQIGCSHMSPQISLERLKRAISLKPGAVQIILPDWFPPSITEVMRFLEKMATTAAPIGLVLYNPPHAKVKLQPNDFSLIQQAGIPLVGCKLPGGDVAWYKAMKEHAAHLSIFIPGHHLASGISGGAHGAYSNVACLNPAAAQQWYKQMKLDMKGALELQGRIQEFMNKYIVPFITEHKFSNQSVDKFLAAVGGWVPISQRLRWPYDWIGSNEIDRVRSGGQHLLPEFFERR
ncbi:MAG TPA: dihydrodipicolinate synthase family protein [Flavisolibacter sp.]|jgi:dihydrodipicolinate synthase/N-acetylneuraminate lyase|nr:dihydrodipicolinate synthase family protein [Flavisolibacter sp.]